MRSSSSAGTVDLACGPKPGDADLAEPTPPPGSLSAEAVRRPSAPLSLRSLSFTDRDYITNCRACQRRIRTPAPRKLRRNNTPHRTGHIPDYSNCNVDSSVPAARSKGNGCANSQGSNNDTDHGGNCPRHGNIRRGPEHDNNPCSRRRPQSRRQSSPALKPLSTISAYSLSWSPPVRS